MKRLIVLAIISAFVFNPLSSQTVDSEVQRLINIVASLRLTDRQQQKEAWNKASTDLKNDKSGWTIMDEITPDRNNECKLTDRTMHWFSINRLLTQHAGYDDTKVRGEFNNGEDPNFNYSLIERSVKAGATVSYNLKAREGRQLFVIMPFESAQNTFDVEVLRKNARLAKGVRKPDGNIYVEIPQNKKVQKSDVLTLKVKNTSKSNMAFVIINHNTREK